MTQNMIKTWGKHLAAIAVLLVITIAYFSPAVLDGKVIQQGDMLKADGMGNSQMKQYEETAEPGEFWLSRESSLLGRTRCLVVCLTSRVMAIRLPTCRSING